MIKLDSITYSSNAMMKFAKSIVDSSDDESSSDESSSDEELVSNFVAFTASHSIIEDVCVNSLCKEIDQNHQEC